MLVHQRLPRQKFVDRESVTAAGFLKRQQSTTHGKNHLSLTANDPALRARVRQIGNCQWAAIRPRQRGRRRPSQQSIWWAARHADLHSPALRSPSRKRERSAGSAYTVFVSTWSIDKSGCSVSVWASAAFASSILPSSAKDTAHRAARLRRDLDAMRRSHDIRRWSPNRRIDDPNHLAQEVAAWVRQRNAAGARIKWMFTTDKARNKMGRAYPQAANEL